MSYCLLPRAEQYPIGAKVRKVYENGKTFEGVVSGYRQPDIVMITNADGDVDMWRPNLPNSLDLIE